MPSCYSMQLSGVLGEAKLVPDEIRTSAAVTGDASSGAFTVKSSHLTVEAKIPGATEAQFLEAAQKAKEICPISRLLHGSIDITLDAKLLRLSHAGGRDPDHQVRPPAARRLR